MVEICFEGAAYNEPFDDPIKDAKAVHKKTRALSTGFSKRLSSDSILKMGNIGFVGN